MVGQTRERPYTRREGFHQLEPCTLASGAISQADRRLELLVDNSGPEQNSTGPQTGPSVEEHARIVKALPFLERPGTLRLQINIIPVPDGHGHALRPRLPCLPFNALASVFSAGAPAILPEDDDSEIPAAIKTGKSLDDQTFALFRDIQMRGASGLALELLNPQLDGISDPNVRLKFASIVFDMMHVRGRYADAAELIGQELALHPRNAGAYSPLLLPLKIRLVDHQMFYRPINEL